MQSNLGVYILQTRISFRFWGIRLVTHGHLESVVGQHLAAILVHQVVARQQVHLQKMETILLIFFLNNLLIEYLGNLLCGRRIYLKNCQYVHEISTFFWRINQYDMSLALSTILETNKATPSWYVDQQQTGCLCLCWRCFELRTRRHHILCSGVHNREKTISWHLIPIIAFVSLFSSSQLYPSFYPSFIPARETL